MSRRATLELALNEKVNVPTVCAAIMAWGGMDLRHRDSLFHSGDREWLDVAHEIRSGMIDRKTAYDRLRELTLSFL